MVAAVQWTCCQTVHGLSVAWAMSADAAGAVYFGMNDFLQACVNICDQAQPLLRIKSNLSDDPRKRRKRLKAIFF